MIPAQLFLGAGTVINALCIVVGAAVGTLFGEHLPSRVRDAVTPVLGLVVVTIGGLSIPSLLDASVPRSGTGRRGHRVARAGHRHDARRLVAPGAAHRAVG
ncbi:DUF554 family protein [Propionibacterium freudenreichii]|nr:DUF554 family protein [Propionibacterium freudenreichii]CEG86886.1 Putative uncharacterized protein [Propionibacterium freudenreichii]CEI26247.1 Protein of unknown function [Propionibacterium freudenreichii]